MSMLSSQHHSFDIAMAAMYGMECAVLIHHFQHWIRINQFHQRNIKNGRCWTYQTRKEIQAHFPYWSFEEVKYLCEKLVKKGVLVTANYNKLAMDKTLWYAFADEKAFMVDAEFSNNLYEREKSPSRGKSPFREGKSPQAIPDTKTTDTKTTDEETTTPPTPSKGGEQARDVASSKGLKEEFKKSRNEGDALRAQFMKALKDGDKVNRALKMYNVNLGKFPKTVSNPIGWVIDAIRNDRDLEPLSGVQLHEYHREKATQIRDFHKNRNDIYVYADRLVFATTTWVDNIEFWFNEPDFIEMVKVRMNVMGLTWAGIFD